MAGVAANDALFSSMVLAAAADVTDTLWKTHVHPDYVRVRGCVARLTLQVPLAVLTLLHAVRVSHGTRLISGGRSARLGLFQSVVLNQVVLFGAATVVGTCTSEQNTVLTPQRSCWASRCPSSCHPSLWRCTRPCTYC